MKWNAYHFVGDTLCDGSPVPANGVTLKWDGPLEMCHSGFHASRKSWQALDNAPGPILFLCRVRCGGEMVEGRDKLVCRERTIVFRIDATSLLRRYARLCALDAIHLWEAPPVVVRYLKTGDESLRVAARVAARDAASVAARGVARDAAWGAARVAAWGTAWTTPDGAAWNAARAKQRNRFANMVNAAFRKETE